VIAFAGQAVDYYRALVGDVMQGLVNRRIRGFSRRNEDFRAPSKRIFRPLSAIECAGTRSLKKSIKSASRFTASGDGTTVSAAGCAVGVALAGASSTGPGKIPSMAM